MRLFEAPAFRVARLEKERRCEDGGHLIAARAEVYPHRTRDQDRGFLYPRFYFLLCLPWKAAVAAAAAAQSLLPPTQKTSSLLDARGGGKSSPDVTSNKGKATGIEGGIRPIFGLTLRDPASSWHLSIFLLFCSLAEGSLVTSRLKGPFYFSFFYA